MSGGVTFGLGRWLEMYLTCRNSVYGREKPAEPSSGGNP